MVERVGECGGWAVERVRKVRRGGREGGRVWWWACREGEEGQKEW